MKKVLIIAYLDPAYGSFRPVPLARHLPEFGWEPIVLTAPYTEKSGLPFRIIETSYHDVLGFWKKLFRLNPDEGIGRQLRKRLNIRNKRSLIDYILLFAGELFAYPDLCRGWKSFAVRAGVELLQRERIEAIISCMPVTGYIVASELKTRYKIPWVVDLTDLWSQNHDYPYSFLRRLRDRRLERKTLSTADALVTVSEPWAEKLRTLHPGKPVFTITHGFAPEAMNTTVVNLSDKFTITYTGTIYPGKQDPAILLVALRDLLSEGVIDARDVEVRFYGTVLAWLDREIERYGLSQIVKQYARVPKEVAQEKQRESQLLLLLDWNDPKEPGVYMGKIFEYLGARRPILAIGGARQDVVAQLLQETQAGVLATTVSEVKETLRTLYQSYRQQGQVPYNGIEGKVAQYSHREMARKFSEILDRLV